MQRKLNLFATQRLIELFSNIDHRIAQTFIESIRYRNSFPVSYLDFGEGNDSISFITRNKYDDIQKSNPGEWNSLVWKDKRSEMKIGKLIRMFYGDNFPTNHPKDKPRPKPMVDIESFVNKFKAERDKDVNYDRFEIVEGKDFHYWYTQNNYSRFVHEETTLGRSCLRYEESSKFLKMYSMNPDTFRMLILKDDNGKLRGRANLWTLEKPEGRIYMDRIYSVNDFDVELFKDYARQNGWIHKEAQTYGWHNNVVDTRTGEIHKWDNLTMLARIKNTPGNQYKYYPYLDTLSIYNTKEHTLTNDGRLRVLNPHIILTDYQGSYHSEVDGRERVFSTAYNEYIIRDEAKFVEIDDTWIYENDAVYVHNSGGKFAFRNSDLIVESYIYKRKFFLKSDAVFSDYLGTYIHEGSVRIAFIDEEKKEEVKIHYRMVGREFEEKDGVIIKKKISQNQNQFSKHSPGDKYSFDEILRRIQNGTSSSSGRRISANDIMRNSDWARLVEQDQSPSGNTIATNDNEEDGDPFSGVNLDNYSPELVDYLYGRLEEQRDRRRNPVRDDHFANLLSGNIGSTQRANPRRTGASRVERVEMTRPVNPHPVDEPQPDRPRVTDEPHIRFTPTADIWGVREEPVRREVVREEPVPTDPIDEMDLDFGEPETRDEVENAPEDTNEITGGTFQDRWRSYRTPNYYTFDLETGPNSNSYINYDNDNVTSNENFIRNMYQNLGVPPRFLGRDNTNDNTDNDDGTSDPNV